MPSKRRKFQRPLGERRYHTIFIIAAEGIKTEKMYFDLFRDMGANCIPGDKKTTATHILRRLQRYLKDNNVIGPFEAWLVLDKDDNDEGKLTQVHQWVQSADNRGMALSNPKFEYWLLLHFEDGDDVGSSQECSDRLKRYLPQYDKGIDSRKVTLDRINHAIRQAKKRDTPPCSDWPRMTGTTVYRLVKKLLKNQNE